MRLARLGRLPSSRWARCASSLHPASTFSSKFFDVETVKMADQEEQVVRGGRHLFPKLEAALEGVKQIGVIGWGSQGPAQAQNLRESLEGSAVKVKVGLRDGSSSMAAARACGFTEESGTLGEMYSVISESDMVLLLISDAACVQEYKNVFKALKPKTTLGLSHGFLLGHLESSNDKFPADVDVVLCAPKGMGPSVRRLYEQGREVNGSGINASFGVHQDVTGHATERALAWAVGVGSPYVFQTTLNAEWRSDIFGERCILLGGVHGMIEALFRYYESLGMSAKDAFQQSGEVITGPLTRIISHDGIRAVYESLTPADQETFRIAYCASYKPSRSIIEECYDSVSSGNEIRDVVMASQRFDRFPMGIIDNTRTWRVANEVRAAGGTPEERKHIPVHPVTAGVYCSMMMVCAPAPRAPAAGDWRGAHARCWVAPAPRHRPGPDRLPLRPRPRLLGDRQRERHRVCGLPQPLHARAGRLVHGGQLLGDRATRLPQVGPALRLHPHGAGLSRHRREERSGRQALPEFLDTPRARHAQDVLRAAPIGGHLRRVTLSRLRALKGALPTRSLSRPAGGTPRPAACTYGRMRSRRTLGSARFPLVKSGIP